MSTSSQANTQTTALLARLTALSSDHKTTQSLISRLAKFPSQPGASPLNSSAENDARVELSSEIHQSLKEQEDALELLRQEVEDLPPALGDHHKRKSSAGISIGSGGRRESTPDAGRGTTGAGDRTRLEVGVRRLGEDLKLSHTQFRRAQLAAKRASEAAKRKERELLFAGVGQEEAEAPRRRQQPGKEKLSQDELVVNASSDVTASLRRTHQLMSAELSRSQFAQETLDQSTAALSSLTTHYSNLDTLLSSSRNLLGTLLRSQKSDTWYLESAFYILLCTIVWLVFRRLLYGPLWWLVWLPLKLLFSVGSWVTAGLFGTSASGEVAGTTALLNTRPPLIVKPSAQREDIPRYNQMADQDGQQGGPSINVGGGAKGGGGYPPPAPSQDKESMIDQVGKMAEESRNKGGENTQEQSGSGEGGDQTNPQGQGGAHGTEEDVPRNPKKRMWEEPIQRGVKDEL